MTLESVTKLENSGTLLSLYTGAGGMDIGFHRAGFKTLWSNEISRDAVNTFSSYNSECVSTCGDIESQSIPQIDVDLVIGGPPCQGFSVAGKMDLNDPRSKHVWNFFKVVEFINPMGFVMENVKSLAKNRRFSQLISDLENKAIELGYKTSLHILNAAHYGVPQSRERMFLIGFKEFEIPKPIETTLNNPVSVREAFKDLPSFGENGNNSTCTAKITPAKNPILRKSPYSGMLFNGQGRPINLDRPSLTLPASMGGNRTPIIDQNLINGSSNGWIEKYYDSIINGNKINSEPPKSLRRITVEEAARLQTFPSNLKFHGSQSSQYRQIGNAVPPLLAYHIATTMREALFQVKNFNLS